MTRALTPSQKEKSPPISLQKRFVLSVKSEAERFFEPQQRVLAYRESSPYPGLSLEGGAGRKKKLAAIALRMTVGYFVLKLRNNPANGRRDPSHRLC